MKSDLHLFTDSLRIALSVIERISMEERMYLFHVKSLGISRVRDHEWDRGQSKIPIE